MSIANGIPQVELPSDYPIDMIFRLQDTEFLVKTHDFIDSIVPQFGLQQAGLQLMTYAAMKNISLAAAVDLGAGIYTSAVGVVTDPNEYISDTAYDFTYQGVKEFQAYVGLDEDKLLEKLREARSRMENDAPQLTEVVEEVAGHYYREKGMRDLALFGAAAMRGLHILVNRRLLSSRFSDDDAEALLA